MPWAPSTEKSVVVPDDVVGVARGRPAPAAVDHALESVGRHVWPTAVSVGGPGGVGGVAVGSGVGGRAWAWVGRAPAPAWVPAVRTRRSSKRTRDRDRARSLEGTVPRADPRCRGR